MFPVGKQNKTKVYFLLYLSYCVLASGFYVNVYENDFSRFNHIHSFPTIKELPGYLRSLSKVLNNLARHSNYYDDNMLLGIFFCIVNLQRSLSTQGLPEDLTGPLLKALAQSTSILKKIEGIDAEKNLQHHGVRATDMYNLTLLPFWVQRMESFRIPHSTIKSTKDPALTLLRNKYPDFEDYTKFILDVERHVPNPNFSDYCLLNLSEMQANTQKDGFQRCNLERKCFEMVTKGDDWGYALTHRILFMMTARNSRGCVVFSSEEDREMVKELCGVGYQEAEYIASYLTHGHTRTAIIDLLMEYMALCALSGDSSFMQRSWLTLLLSYQSPTGCFHDTNVYHEQTDLIGSMKPQDSILMINRTGPWCVGHATSVAITALTGAIRFIVETY